MVKRPFFIIVTGAPTWQEKHYLRGGPSIPPCRSSVPRLCPPMEYARPGSSLTCVPRFWTNDNESYFFAELKRLKLIIDKLQAGEELFIILDGSLKGAQPAWTSRKAPLLYQQFADFCRPMASLPPRPAAGNTHRPLPDDIRNYRFK